MITRAALATAGLAASDADLAPRLTCGACGAADSRDKVRRDPRSGGIPLCADCLGRTSPNVLAPGRLTTATQRDPRCSRERSRSPSTGDTVARDGGQPRGRKTGGGARALRARRGRARRARRRRRRVDRRIHRGAARPRRGHVLAVDVGHGQLHPSLRRRRARDVARGGRLARLSLNEAEGPFDFFTVDVSFVAARNMLRGLAFRLRPGARGRRAGQAAVRARRTGRSKAGDVDDANLRRAALDKVRRRAEALGFTLVGQIDSPVAGGEAARSRSSRTSLLGTPDERCPALGESRGDERHREAQGARARPLPRRCAGSRSSRPDSRRPRAREIAALPDAADLRPEVGGVEWSAPAVERLPREPLAAHRHPRARARRRRSRRASSASCGGAPPRLAWSAFVAPGRVALRARERQPLPPLPHGRDRRDGRAGDRRRGPGRARWRRTTRPPTCRSWCAASRITSPSASTPRASGCTAAARASRPARRRCARRWPPACWRSPAGRPATALVDPMCGAGTIVHRGGAAGARPGARDRGVARSRSTRWPLFSAGDASTEAAALRDEARGAHARRRSRRRAADRRLGSRRARHRERAPQRRARRRRRGADAREPRRRPTRVRPAPHRAS